MSSRNTHLDFVRGIAAIGVLSGHLRSFFFLDISKINGPSIFDKVFYFVTGYGYQMVMIFFVLSGYFIGGAVQSSVSKNKWSWRQYGINRLTRLGMVLIPAQVLTVFWDRLGTLINGGIGYDGRYSAFLHSGPTPRVPAAFGTSAFFGNLAFLKHLLSPIYGSNGPIWSLAYEFWYYVLFPLIYLVAVSKDDVKRKVFYLVVFAACLVILPKELLQGGLVWLMGFGAYALVHQQKDGFFQNRIIFCGFLLALLGCLFLSRQGDLPYSEYLIGLAFAGTLPYLSKHSPVLASEFNSGVHHLGVYLYSKMSTGLSQISYTLYLVHFPFLTFYFFVFRLPYQNKPGIGSYLTYGLLFCGTLIYAFLIWFLFEKRTEQVKSWLKSKV